MASHLVPYTPGSFS